MTDTRMADISEYQTTFDARAYIGGGHSCIIVRAHNGRIEVESNVGKGTTFRVWLPLHERRPRLLEAKTQN